MSQDHWPSNWMRQFELDDCDDNIVRIEASLRKRIEEGARFSADKKNGFLYIADELRLFELHLAFRHAFADDLKTEIEKKSGWENKTITNLGDLIDLFHRISKVNDFLSKLIERFDIESFDNNFSDEVNAELTLRNYCIRLRGHLSAIAAMLAAKHTKRKGSFLLQSGFCILCWRRVRHFDRNEDHPKARESQFYCEYHSPSKNTSDYHTAVSALVAAVKRENAEKFHAELTKYDDRKNVPINLAPIFSRWFKSFLLRIPQLKRNIVQSEQEWLDTSFWLCEIAVAIYPVVAERIDYSFNPPPNSWREWVLKVIELLDDEKQEELQYWRDNATEDWTNFSEWQTILHLFARYEAYHYIQENRPKIGRPGGKKDLAVEFILGCYKNSQHYPTINEICQAIDINKSTASKALKEAQKLSENITSERCFI